MARPDWTWKEYPGVYDPPAVPEHYNNPQWSTHDLYYTFGLAKDYDSHNNLIYDGFERRGGNHPVLGDRSPSVPACGADDDHERAPIGVMGRGSCR